MRWKRWAPHHILSKPQSSELSSQVFTFLHSMNQTACLDDLKAYLVSPLQQKCILLPSSVLHCPAPFLMMKHESCLLESSSPAFICPCTHLTCLWFHCLASVMCVSPSDRILLTSMDYSPISLYRHVNTVVGCQTWLFLC